MADGLVVTALIPSIPYLFPYLVAKQGTCNPLADFVFMRSLSLDAHRAPLVCRPSRATPTPHLYAVAKIATTRGHIGFYLLLKPHSIQEIRSSEKFGFSVTGMAAVRPVPAHGWIVR